MANIQSFLDQISGARYGKDVRASIVNALDAVNKDANYTVEVAGNMESLLPGVVSATASANTAATNANEAAKAVFDEKYILTARTEFAKSASLTPTAKGNAILESVLGDSFQKQLSGKNFFNPYDYTSSLFVGSVGNEDWITVEKDNSGGTDYAYANCLTRLSSHLSPSTPYAIVIEVKEITEGAVIYVHSNDSDSGQFVGQALMSTVGTKVIIATTRDTFENAFSMLRTFIRVSAGVNAKAVFRLSVLEDITVTAETFVYEPYCGGIASPNPDYPQEIESVGTVTIKVQNKNLLKMSVGTDTASGVTIVKTVDGFSYSGTSTASISRGVGSVTLSAGTYTISTNKLPQKYVRYEFLNSKGYTRICSAFTSSSGAKTRTFVLTEETRVVVALQTDTTGIEMQGTDIAIQIEKGSTATDYTPHAEHEITIPLSEPLHKNDEICVVDGVYGVFRKITEKNLAELEWSMSTSYAYPIFYASISDKKIGSIDGLSNKFTFDAVNTSAYAFGNHGADNTFAFVASNTQILVRCDAYTDVESFKEAMGDAVAQYELATPVFEPFEDQTPFYELMAYDEVTNISFEGLSENVSPTATVRFPRNEDGALVTTNWCDNKKNEIKMEELTAALLALSQE